MGSPGIPVPLRRNAAGAGRTALHEPAQPVLTGQASAGSPGAESLSMARGAGGSQADHGATGTGNGGPSRGGAASESRSAGQAIGQKRTTGTGRPKRGRPRSANTDRIILIAAAEVMAEKGIGGLSIEEVALRARVGKTTIYRRWPSRGTLALDAFLAEFEGLQGLPNTGTFAGDLRAALGAWVKAISGTSAGAMLVGLIAEMQQDSKLAERWQNQVIAPLRAQYSIMLDRGVLRGEIPETDAGIVIDLLFGACYYRLLLQGQHGQRPLNEQFVNQVVNVIAAGVGARTELPCRWLPPGRFAGVLGRAITK